MSIIHDFVEKHGSQHAAARALGVSQAAIWKWLNGLSTPSPAAASRIAKDMGVSMEDVYSTMPDWNDKNN